MIGKGLKLPELIVEIDKNRFLESINKTCETINRVKDNKKIIEKLEKIIPITKEKALSQLKAVVEEVNNN